MSQSLWIDGFDAKLWHETAAPHIESISLDLQEGRLPALTIVNDPTVCANIASLREKLAEWDSFDKIYIFGTGGSSLGGKSLSELFPESRLIFCDNVDPSTLQHHLEVCDVPKSGMIFISKSGQTLETLTQALVFMNLQKDLLGASIGNHSLVLTESSEGLLAQAAHHYGVPVSLITPKIGGRFSVFSEVGLIPATLDNLDINAFHQGGADALKNWMTEGVASQAAIGAMAMWHSAQRHNVSELVMLPYRDNLAVFSQWFQQLFGESLGKNGLGFTPLAARGTVDQHSQLQLYLEGPRNKFITLITENHTGRGPLIPNPLALPYLHNKTLGDVLTAEQDATRDTLIRHGIPVREIHLDTFSAEQGLGWLMMQSMLEVILLARLMNIDPFDQPAVEEGKRLAIERLSA